MNLNTILTHATSLGHTVTEKDQGAELVVSDAQGEIVARYKREQPKLLLLDYQEEKYPCIVITREE